MPLLAISAHDIDVAGLPVRAELPLGWLKEELADAALEGVGPGHVEARLSRTGNEIVVRGKVTAELTTPCARCTEPAKVDVTTELSLLLKPHSGDKAGTHGHKGEEEYEFSSDEADVDLYDGETVVLDGFVREAILLEVPNFPLCSEECPGIRRAPAAAPEEAGPPVDPRLAPLGALREKLQSAGKPAEKPSSKKKKKE